MTDDWRGTLRTAVYTGDGKAVLEALGRGRWDDALQLAGDGLRIAISQGIPGASELATRCPRELRERVWDGDGDLADQLEAALDMVPKPPLLPLPVDLDELSMLLEGGLGFDEGGRIDLRSGQIWPHTSIEEARENGDEDDDESEAEYWLYVHGEGSRAGYRDMERFIATIGDKRLANRLQLAISGRGAFRRFKDALARDSAELERWYAFSDEREMGRARAWLVSEGYAAVPAALRPS